MIANNDIVYIFPPVIDKPIKVVTNNTNILNNADGTFTINQRIYPEEMYKVDGKLYMKWHGEWYELGD